MTLREFKRTIEEIIISWQNKPRAKTLCIPTAYGIKSNWLKILKKTYQGRYAFVFKPSKKRVFGELKIIKNV